MGVKGNTKIVNIHTNLYRSIFSFLYDENGFNTTVFEKNVIQASLFIMKWWESSEERQKSHKLLEDAIYGCTKLDEELGLIKGNRDNLD